MADKLPKTHWQIFNSPEGRDILKDLNMKYAPQYYENDPQKTQERLAQYEVVKHIERMIQNTARNKK